jgi:ketosteroid isomerase-like protein
MTSYAALRNWTFALLSALALMASPAHAQLVDTPQNLLKAWMDAYATRAGEPMTKVYAPDAHYWGYQSKEPAIGAAAIRAHFERTGQGVVERSATITKTHINPRKRLTIITGTVELKAKLKDGATRNQTARFQMGIVRESRRQWAILSHVVSLLPQ